MAESLVTMVAVQGCHDCPMLENQGFGTMKCRFLPYPMEIFVDPLDLRPPPKGCPLLNGGLIFITLEAPKTVSR